jgi:hypothetical protein
MGFLPLGRAATNVEHMAGFMLHPRFTMVESLWHFVFASMVWGDFKASTCTVLYLVLFLHSSHFRISVFGLAAFIYPISRRQLLDLVEYFPSSGSRHATSSARCLCIFLTTEVFLRRLTPSSLQPANRNLSSP